MYNFIKKIIICFCLITNQTNHAWLNIPIKISYADVVKENLNTHQPFRVLLLKNAAQNLGFTYNYLRNNEYGAAMRSLTLGSCSAITLLSYPADNNWSYLFVLNKNQSVILSAIAIASCCDTVLKPNFKNISDILGIKPDPKDIGLTWGEIIIYAGICTIPFFNSLKYFTLNVNK